MTEKHLSIRDLERIAECGVRAKSDNKDLLHLQTCGVCRRALTALPSRKRGVIENQLAALGSGWKHPPSSYSRALSAAFGKVSKEGQELDRERLLAPALLADVESLSPTQQGLLIRNSERYQSWAIAEELLSMSRSTWTENPRQAEHYALIAIEVTATLKAVGFRERILNDLKAEAWSYVGNCRRIQTDFSGGKEAFSIATKFLEVGTGDPFERAQFDDLRASMLREERRFVEAAKLLRNVVRIYREAGSQTLEARSLLTLARVLGDSGEIDESLRTIRRSIQLLKSQDEPWLALIAHMQLVYFLDDAGRAAEAQTFLPELRRLVRQAGGRLDRLRVLWTEGRIQRSLGRFELAEEALKQVRAGFIDAEIGYDVALVSLDLAALYLETGRTAEVKELAAEMLPQFAARQIHREALAAIALFEQAARKERATLALVQEISSKVKDASTRRTPPENG